MFYYCYRVVSSFHKVNKTFEKHLNEEFSSLNCVITFFRSADTECMAAVGTNSMATVGTNWLARKDSIMTRNDVNLC